MILFTNKIAYKEERIYAISRKYNLLSKKSPITGTNKQIIKFKNKKTFQNLRLKVKGLLNKKGSPNKRGCINTLENQALME